MILGADGAAVTAAKTTADRMTCCTTDAVIARLEDLQDVTGEGPCLDAFRYGTYFTLTVDETPDTRWPEFTRAAVDAVGRVTIFSFPMRPGGRTLGVVSAYLVGEGQLPEPTGAAQLVADVVGAALLRDPALSTAGALGSRDEVSLASGMVVAQLHVPPDDALAILRAHAYATNTTLAATARRVLNRELDFREGL
ncbi:ANTAR domain-containing protein [Kribbella sancticallisti]|uniref:ANTAR domain-containing protein n=1 Tax=Kribbella sancticallisti TaxID=460087 RepID=UPI0031D1A2AE